MKKYFDIEIDGQVELENGKTLGELKESNISITNPDEETSGDPVVKNAKETGGFGWTEDGEKIYYAESQTISLDNGGLGTIQKKDGAITVEQIYDAGIREITVVVDGENLIGYVEYDYDGDYYYVQAYKDDSSIQITDSSSGQYNFYYYVKRNANVTVEFYYAPVIIHSIDSKYLKSATLSKAGVVKKAGFVSEAQGDTVTGAEFNQLLYTLQSAGILATSYDVE